MTEKHTLGPWGLGLGDNESQDVCTETGEHICTVEQYPIKENALLIASAPDLLKALKIIANSEEQHGDTVVCDFETLQGVARAAIAKAKGA